jgi:hypothetical protein
VKAQFEPVADVPGDLLRSYLLSRGWPAELIEWKYFDPAFNRGRNRGYVWIHEGKVSGLIGNIPGRLAHGNRTFPVVWACDWSIEAPDATPGLGVFLFQRAVASEPRFIGAGGNENSLKLFPRLAERTVEQAAVDYHIPMRLDAFLEQAGRRAPSLKIDRWPLLGTLPVPYRAPASPAKTVTEPGVPDVIEPVFSGSRARGWHPTYELADVQWAVGRCPAIEAFTTYDRNGACPSAAVVHWRSVRSAKRWHGTLWTREEDPERLSACLSEAVRNISRRGGSRLTIMVSCEDRDYIRLLKSHGALKGKNTPLFIFRTDEDLKGFTEPRRLSFQDSDYSVLF